MRKSLTLTAAALLLAGSSACRDEPTAAGVADAVERSAGAGVQASVSGSPGDIAAIQQIVNTFDASWTAGDATTYAAQYAGAEWVGPDGTVRTDPAAITGVYTFLFAVVFPHTVRQSTIRDLTFFTGTVAVLDIDTKVTGIPAGLPFTYYEPGTVRAREKNILLKRGGEWRIVKHQQVPVAPGVPCPGCP